MEQIMEQLPLRVPADIKAQIKALNEERKHQGIDETLSATTRFVLRLGLSIANNGGHQNANPPSSVPSA